MPVFSKLYPRMSGLACEQYSDDAAVNEVPTLVTDASYQAVSIYSTKKSMF
jgi:hypothetical protein